MTASREQRRTTATWELQLLPREMKGGAGWELQPRAKISDHMSSPPPPRLDPCRLHLRRRLARQLLPRERKGGAGWELQRRVTMGDGGEMEPDKSSRWI